MADEVIGVPLPPPYKGQNDQFPLISISSPYAERIENFNNKGGILKLRQGNDLFSTIVGVANALAGSLNLSSYDSTTPLLFHLIVDNVGLDWRDITAGGAGVSVRTIAAGAETEVHTLFYDNYLFYFGTGSLDVGSTGPQFWNGTAWGTSALTWPASFNPFGGNTYKSRAYFIGESSTTYGYTELNAPAAGTVTKVDLAELVSSKSLLYIIRSATISQSVSQENVQAFIFSNGEILVYTGSYPDSSTWGLISRLRISKPIYQNSYVDAKGDSFIFTESEILSLRNILLYGYDKEREQGMGSTIKNRWRQIMESINSGIPVINQYRFVRGIYDEKNDRIVISFPFYVDPITGTLTLNTAFQLIYDFTLQAWYEYVQTSTTGYVRSNCYHNNNVFFAFDNAITTGRFYAYKLEGNTNFLDDAFAGAGATTAIAYKVKSAPYPLSKFGVIFNLGLETVMKSDIYSGINFQFIADLGVQTTNAQNIDGVSGVVYKGLVNMGIIGNIVQYQISGNSSSSTYGIEVYATNLWVSKSGGLSR